MSEAGGIVLRVPREIVHLVSGEVRRILALPDVRERIVSQGATPKSGTPEEFDRFLRAEVETRIKVLKAAGAKAD